MSDQPQFSLETASPDELKDALLKVSRVLERVRQDEQGAYLLRIADAEISAEDARNLATQAMDALNAAQARLAEAEMAHEVPAPMGHAPSSPPLNITKVSGKRAR